MKTYAYSGFDAAGRTRRGMVEADSRKEAREQLAGQGIWTEGVEEVSGAPSRSRRGWGRQGFRAEQRAVLYRELASLLQAGVALIPALELLLQAPEAGSVRVALAGVRDRVREGQGLAESLAEAFPELPPMEQAVLRAGESIGSPGPLLEQLADVLEERQQVVDRIGNALVYPLVVAGCSVLIAMVVVGVLLPSLRDMLAGTDLVLPWSTRALLALGEGGLAGLFGGCLGAGAVGFLGWRWMQRTPARRQQMDRLSYRIPGWGTMRRTLVRLRFARTLALLLQGGIDVLQAVGLAAGATGSPWVVYLAARAVESIRQGEGIAPALAGIPPLGESLPGWVRAGEASGNIPALLDRAADQCQRQWARRLERALSLLEPVLIIVVGAVVLFLALAVLLPILSLNEALG